MRANDVVHVIRASLSDEDPEGQCLNPVWLASVLIHTKHARRHKRGFSSDLQKSGSPYGLERFTTTFVCLIHVASTWTLLWARVHLAMCCCCWSLLYNAILRSRADSLRSHVILPERLVFYSAFLNIHRSGVFTTLFDCYIADAMWNCCHLGALCVHHTHHAPCHATSHKSTYLGYMHD